MKSSLDKIDLRILAELDRNCRTPSTLLAKKVRRSRQAVDYRINNLVKRGIITGFNASFNPYRIGYKAYKFYLSLRNVQEKRQALLKHLESSKSVYWMGECSGRWDLIFAALAKTDGEFFDFKNSLLSRFGDIIIDVGWQIILRADQYPKGYFTGQPGKPVMFGGDVTNGDLDALDSRILDAVIDNGRVSLVELTGAVGSTIPVVQRRLRRLEQSGVIIQYRIGVDLGKLGMELYKAVISFDSYTKEDEARISSYFSDLPGTQYFIVNLWNVEVELAVRNFQEYYAIIEGVRREFPRVVKTVESVLMMSDRWTPGF